MSLCKDFNLGNDIFAGKHGATPIINSQSSTTADRVGVVESTPQSVQVYSPVGRLLCQSRFQGSTGVSLVESVMIPPRTEMHAFIRGKIGKGDYRNVPLRVLNASNTQIELVAGENLEDFRPLIELCLSQPRVCGAVGNKTSPQVISDKIESIIDPSLQEVKRGKLKNLLLEFSDVFDENLGHTTILTH